MFAFVAAAAVLVALVLAVLFRPFFWRGTTARAVARSDLNAAIYRDQLARLERDRDDGLLSAEDHEASRAELQRRLLDDVTSPDAQARLQAPRKTLWAVGLTVPLLALALYLGLGKPATLDAQGPQHRVDSQELETMLAGLAKKLEGEPDNLKGWVMLARSYKALGRNADAEKAFEHAMPLVQTDAQLLADYADVIATNARGNLAGRPTELIAQALKVDPNNGMALWLSGTAAFQRGDFDAAIGVWEALVAQLDPDSEDGQMLRNAIAEAYTKAGKSAPVVAAAPAKPGPRAASPATAAAPAAASAGLSGTVDIDPALKDKVQPNHIVMVIARPVGARMPIAVLRAPASQLPLQFTLDDSHAMNPQMLLSRSEQVDLDVRISKTGMAMPEAGDLQSKVQTVKVGSQNLRLRVDHVRP